MGKVEGMVLEEKVFLITIPMPLRLHSKMLSLLKKLPRQMPHKSGDLHPSMTVNSVVLFMGPICVVPKIIAGFLAWTSANPPTSAPVATNLFTAGCAPDGVWKVLKCGVFVARN